MAHMQIRVAGATIPATHQNKPGEWGPGGCQHPCLLVQSIQLPIDLCISSPRVDLSLRERTVSFPFSSEPSLPRAHLVNSSDVAAIGAKPCFVIDLSIVSYSHPVRVERDGRVGTDPVGSDGECSTHQTRNAGPCGCLKRP